MSASLQRSCLALAMAASLVACDDPPETQRDGLVASAEPSAPPTMRIEGVLLPPKQRLDTNPFELPAQTLTVKAGQSVYVVPERMLRGARLGSALEMRSAKVVAQEGQELTVRILSGRPFTIHPAYVVVPQPGRIKAGAPIMASYRGRLRHGVVRRAKAKGLAVRFTDLGIKLGDQTIPRSRIGVLGPGLVPGSYAVMRGEHAYEHVLLISRVPKAADPGWFALGYNGESRIVSEALLQPLPVRRFRPKVGETLRVAWRGEMVTAKLRSLDRPGLFTVKRPRAGAPLLVGHGMIMPYEK